MVRSERGVGIVGVRICGALKRPSFVYDGTSPNRLTPEFTIFRIVRCCSLFAPCWFYFHTMAYSPNAFDLSLPTTHVFFETVATVGLGTKR